MPLRCIFHQFHDQPGKQPQYPILADSGKKMVVIRMGESSDPANPAFTLSDLTIYSGKELTQLFIRK